jgi:hypothetical protein
MARGDDTCPTPGDVDHALQVLQGGGETVRRPYQAFVLAAPDNVHIDLISGDGVRLAERDLARGGSCAELAQAAAAVIASWLGLFEAEAPLDAPPAARPRPVTAVTAPPALPDPLLFWFTVGLMAAWDGTDTVSGAELAGVITRARLPAGAHLALGATTEHTTPLESGEVRWRRISLSVGPSALRRLGPWRFEAYVAAAGALLLAQGTGFPMNSSFHALDLGAEAGVRVARSSPVGIPWLGIEGQYWPGHQTLLVGGSDRTLEIARGELRLVAGLSLGRDP